MMQQVNGQRTGTGSHRITVVLVGHSYIRRVRDFMYDNPQLANLGFSNVDLYCVAQGGETLGPGRRPIQASLPVVAAYQPCIVFVHIGENDLGRMWPGNIIRELMEFVDELIAHCSTVIVGELLYFPNNRPRHNHAVSLINNYLRQHVLRPHVFWRHRRGLWQAGLYFDGVHLNNYGIYRYWRSLRTIVGRELRRYLLVHH